MGESSIDQKTRDQAEAILREYPPTSGDRYAEDLEAAVAAIQWEASLEQRVTAHEIRLAAAALRRLGSGNPPWPRTWLRERRYLSDVMRRREAGAPQGYRRPKALEVTDRAAIEIGEEESEITRRLAGIPEDRLAELARQAIAGEPNVIVRASLELLKEPAKNRLVRSLMAKRVAAEREDAA